MNPRLAVVGMGVTVLLAGYGGRAAAGDATAYPGMAPVAQYLAPSRDDEIALARSAAPPSVAADSEILTLGAKGYDTAIKGGNGFVCVVLRAWANNFDSSDFWNPRVRAPHCFNAAAVRTVLPTYLRRTEWALSGMSREQMRERTRAALAGHEIQPPETGSMAYMLGKGGYLGDDVHGHWHPHLMLYLPRTAPAAWGANSKGSPLFADASGLEPVTVFFVPVAHWSDGTPDDMSH
jgi:hypothetical protein